MKPAVFIEMLCRKGENPKLGFVKPYNTSKASGDFWKVSEEDPPLDIQIEFTSIESIDGFEETLKIILERMRKHLK